VSGEMADPAGELEDQLWGQPRVQWVRLLSFVKTI